jgi:CheY-like chemotaxis protein
MMASQTKLKTQEAQKKGTDHKTDLWRSFGHPGVLFAVLNNGGRSQSPHPPDLWPTHIAAGFITPETAASKVVLIVEDEPYLCDLIADVLEAEGHHPRKAANGLDALALVAMDIPQLILLDLMMPVMDGWEFMGALKSNVAWQDIPVVIITALYDVARTQRETGAKAIVTKPFDIDQLAEIVRLFAS